MTTRLERAATRLEQRRKDFLAETVAYCRRRPSAVGDGALVLPDGVTLSAPDTSGTVTVSLSLSATIGSTPFTLTDNAGAAFVFESRDYLALIADFADFWAIAGGTAEPARGDFVVQAVAGHDQRFELMNIPGEPSFRISGGNGHSWRIHTKRTAS